MDYATLKLVWWLIIGVLMIGYAVTDGYALGVAGLLTLIGKKDEERRVLINIVAPHWDGNQVWFIALGGCVFAGWPLLYATSFSGFYFAMLLVLCLLIVRPLCFEYRSKVADCYKKYCDLGLMLGGILVPVLLGVAVGNLFRGFGFTFDHTMRSHFSENFWALINPFALFCGVLSLCMIGLQGTTWINWRVTGVIRTRAIRIAYGCAIAIIVLFALGGVWVNVLPGYHVVSIDIHGAAVPLNKTVEVIKGAWLNNYHIYPLAMIAPVLGFVGAAFSLVFIRHIPWLSFLSSSLAIAGIISTAGISLFPFLLPSNAMPNASLTLWDAASSMYTLSIISVIAIVFITIIISYTAWCYYKMWRKIDVATVMRETHRLY